MGSATTGSGGPFGDLLRVLEMLAEHVGTEFDPAQAWAALQGAATYRDAHDGWVEAVSRARPGWCWGRPCWASRWVRCSP